MNNGQQPAYPIVPAGHSGLSKREYFAGLAMASLAPGFYDGKLHEKRVAECAVKYADALLAELENPQS